jgi:hypothetical protein
MSRVIACAAPELLSQLQKDHRMATLTIDGITAYTDSAGEPWSLNQLDANTYQFSIRSGDHFSSPSYSDGTAVERDELSFFDARYSEGTQINLSETITVQPGPTNTASFLVLTQLHATTNVSPTYCPFSIELDQSDHLLVVLQNPSSGWIPVYRSPDPIVRGQPMNLSSQMVMGPSGGGYVGVWLNGTQIVDYHGAVGATNSEYYWKMGIYRGPAAETTTATFSNIDMSTGSASAPTAPSTPTTPTSPTTPITSPTIPPTSTTPRTPTAPTTSPIATTPTTTTTPTTPTTPTTTTTPRSSVTAPVLSVADPTLSVAGRGGAVGLGVNVSTTDPNDSVSVSIRGLSRNQTITNNLDGQTFSGNNITLSAAQVESGLVLNSYGRGGARSGATLTLTASATDPVTGTETSAAPQTITVTNLRSAATTTLSSQPTVTTAPVATLTTSTSRGRESFGSLDQAASNAVATAAPALMSQIGDQVGRGVATSASQIAVTSSSPVTATPTASVASQSYALLNQYLAGSTGRGDFGQIVASVSNAATSGQVSFLTRPQY